MSAACVRSSFYSNQTPAQMPPLSLLPRHLFRGGDADAGGDGGVNKGGGQIEAR